MTRYATAALSAAVGLLYVALIFLVKDAEADAAENTWGAYVFLAVAYLAGAVLALALDRRATWIVGAAAQVVVLVLFAMFGAGLWGPGQGVLDDDLLSGLHLGLWATVVVAAQVVLLVLTTSLARRPAAR